MTLIKKCLSAALLICSPFVTAQVTDLDSLQQQLAKNETVRGDFVQSRHLEMFDQPLSSQGQFTLSKSRGLLWQQASPFPVSLVLTEDKLRQTFAGQAPQIITAKENPMAFYFSHVFLAVFHGDTAALEEQFAVDFKVDTGNWTIALTPNQAPLNAVFKQITLTGRDDIEHLELHELRGDKTDIFFSNQTSEPQGLTDAEQAQFNF